LGRKHRAAADFLGPAARRHPRQKLTVAPPPTQRRRRTALDYSGMDTWNCHSDRTPAGGQKNNAIDHIDLFILYNIVFIPLMFLTSKVCMMLIDRSSI